MKTIIDKYERQELLDLYRTRTNPFSFITTKIDITKAYNYSMKHKNLYAVLVYVFTRALNRVDSFLYRLEDDKVVKYDKINPSYTEKTDASNVAFINVDLCDTLEEFLILNNEAKREFKEKQTNISKEKEEGGYVWLSCLPWFKFSGVIPPFDKSETTPQIIWDKYEIVDGHVYVNVMIMAHHGFVDGFHIAELIRNINEELERINED